jgi:translation initiation factor 3 subunit J
VDSLVRNSVASFTLEETRKLSSSMNAIINEKTKALKDLNTKGSKKKKGKSTGAGGASIVMGKGLGLADDTTNYDNYDDFDGFM